MYIYTSVYVPIEMDVIMWCSESCSIAVDVTSQEQVVPVILHFLQPYLFPPPILTTAGGLVVVDTWLSVLCNLTALMCSVSHYNSNVPVHSDRG